MGRCTSRQVQCGVMHQCCTLEVLYIYPHGFTPPPSSICHSHNVRVGFEVINTVPV